MTERYQVGCSYPFSGSLAVDSVLHAFARNWGGQSDGSGCGFGFRDLDFSFECLVEALAFVDDVRQFCSIANVDFILPLIDERQVSIPY